MDKLDAAKAYPNAIDSLIDDEDHPDIADEDAAHDYLCQRAKVFAQTDKAKGEYCPHPAT